MNKKQQRALSFIIIASVLLMLGSAVYAESYSSTLNVSSQLDGSARYYSGSTINIACRNTYLNTVFNTTSALSTLKLWIKMLQLDSCIVSRELPVDALLNNIAV